MALLDPKAIFLCGGLVDAAPEAVMKPDSAETHARTDRQSGAVEITAIRGYNDFLLRGAVGLVLCSPYQGAFAR